MALLVFTSVLVPVLQMYSKSTRYELTPQSRALLGKANPNLTKKLTFDPEQDLFQFNKEAKKVSTPASGNPLESLKKQVGGGGKDDEQLYSVDASKELTKGVTYYDNQMQLQFKLVPKFRAMKGEKTEGHLVYPLLKGINGQLAYTTTTNGLKENIILYESPGDRLGLTYKLELPDSLEARLLPETGEIGIYSADPALFGEISYGSGNDQQLIEQARKNADKTYLAFKIPAPQVNVLNKAGEPAPASVHSRFSLNGKYLTVTTTGLDDATYPLAIDPTVTITSTNEFKDDANAEDNNLTIGNDRIERNTVTGGSVGTWASTTSLPIANAGHSALFYNGYMYIVGGTAAGGSVTQNYSFTGSQQTFVVPAGVTSVTVDVRGAQGMGDGTGTYYFGGQGGRTQATLSVTPGETLYLNVGGDGGYNGGGVGGNTMGAAGGGASDIRQGGTALSDRKVVAGGGGGAGYDLNNVYGGAHGGAGGGTTGAAGLGGSVSFACIDGGGGTQSAGGAGGGSGTSGSLGQGGDGDGTLDILAGGGGGGYYGGGGGGIDSPNEACGGGGGSSYAGSGTSSVTHTQGYETGDGSIAITYTSATNPVYYAPINTGDGSVGTWNPTSTYTTSRSDHAAVIYNGYMYVIGGGKGASGTECLSSGSNGFCDDVQYAPINSNGTLGTWTSTTALGTAKYGHTSVVYKGYVYVIGGNSPGGTLTTVQYAPVNANGTIGSWATTTALPASRYHHASVVYNGYIYVAGGINSGTGFGSNTLYYAPVNANGTVGSWNTGSIAYDAWGVGFVAYNGYLYITGGYDETINPTWFTHTYYAQINANGSIGSWQGTNAFTTDRENHASLAHNGYLYVIGGHNGATRSDIQKVSISAAGATTEHTATTVLPAARNGHATVVNAGYIYVLGGGTAIASRNNTTYYAAISSTGTIGSWTTATNTFTTTRWGLSAAVYNNYIYILGGISAANGVTNTIYYSQLNTSTGAPGTWAATGATTGVFSARQKHTSLIYNGYMYVAGGQTNASLTGNYQNDLYYVPVTSSGTITANWSSTTFTTARSGHGMVVHAGKLYIFGGHTGAGTYATSILYSTLSSSGVPGAFSTATTSISNRSNFGYTVHNGNLYVAGGQNGNVTYLDDVQYVPFANDGNITASWTTTTSFATARSYITLSQTNGYLHVVGGYTGSTTVTTTQYAQINNGGAGTTGTWASDGGTSFATARSKHTTVIHNGYIYVIGGETATNTHTTNIQFAPLNADGSVGTWANTTNFFSVARNSHTSLVYNGYMYVIGGGDSSSDTQCHTSASFYCSDVQYSLICTGTNTTGGCSGLSAGDLGTWASTTSLPAPRAGAKSAVANGYMYVTGGYDSAHNNTVYYSLIGSSGTVGTWNTTTTFTGIRSNQGTFSNNGYLYVMGGNNGTTALNDVQYALICTGSNNGVGGCGSTAGTVGTWNYTTAFTLPRQGFLVSVQNGYVYILGGLSAGTPTYYNDVLYAPLNSNGSIGTWNAATTFSTGRTNHQGASYNGYVYITGGVDGTSDTNCHTSASMYCSDVQYAPLNSIPRKATYSKLIDLSVNAYVTAVSYGTSGTFPGGLDNIKLKAAPTTGVFGATYYDVAATVPPCDIEGQYLQLFITLDDTQNGTFPDSLGSKALLSDITRTTVDISPSGAPPEKRLRHGAFFNNEILQPFETSSEAGSCG